MNSFNYFCVFCLRLTLFDNKGNFACCQECGILGSNYGAECTSCHATEQYVFWRHDFESGKGSSPQTAVCVKCTGAALWSGEAPKVEGNCRLCLKEDAELNDFGAIKECNDCHAVSMPQSYVKTVECQSCPASMLKQKANEGSREGKFFLVYQGEMKCEECWL